jgi:UDPglucose 6-dehydrogenase
LKDKTVGILGLSFKPNTDDMREAPSITIIDALMKEGASVKAYDPVAMHEAKEVLPNITYCKETYEVAKDADALVFMTEWNQFRSLDLDKLKKLLKKPLVLDLRNIYEPSRMKEKGFEYIAVGR